MPFEDIEIRIARDGTVYLKADNISEDRIRDLREFLEEEIGPIQRLEVIQRPDWDKPAQQAAEDSAKNAEEIRLHRHR